MSQQLTARALPEVRAELVQWLADPGPQGGPARWAQGLETPYAEQERRAAATWSVALRAAELFYIASDMTRMAVSAGLALPSYRLHPEDLPATHGLLLWEEPVTDPYEGGELVGCPIIGMSWAVRGSGVYIRTWCLREDWITDMARGDLRSGIADLTPAEVRAVRLRHPQQIVCMSSGRLPFGKVPGWLSTMPEDTSGMSVAELEDRSKNAGRQEQAERALVVTWLLMGQTLVREEEATPSKASAKHLRRLDPALLTSVRYVQLRHASSTPTDRGRGGGRPYQFRWIVRGHWRNHWYPSRKAHRPIWIDSHMKGPDGAPILDPDKLVNVLRR
ncbi:hypothetical protein ABZ383_34755 [Streptomyces sp. NPDC005900]|uniref:hypothetical protein n=1 Tax=Streptomyces sp. NPDC005900 TaxID=3154569 RepID=UPI0033CFBF59